MTTKSIKINLFLNNLRIVINFLLPLVTFPYTSRVLGPEMLGRVDYAISIVAYFILFATLGIPNYGIRTISGVRDDKKKMSVAVAELSLILTVSTVVVLIIYSFAFFLFPNVFSEKKLYIILGSNIILSAFNLEWFYVGIEDQAFITKRFLIIKILSVLCLFLFVKQSSDYILYALISVVMGSFGTIFNISHLRKHVEFVHLRDLHPVKHIIPILITFGSTLAISIYSYVDITMLGNMAGDVYVGLYSAANKITNMALTVITSLGAIMLPRLSNLFETGNIEKYKLKLCTSLNFTLLISLPAALGIIILGPDFLELLTGSKYEGAKLTLQILAIILLIIPFAHYVGFQILYTNKKELYYTIAVSLGAIANLIANYILIPRYQQNGAAFGSVIAEFVGLFVMCILGHRYIMKYTTFTWKMIIYFLSTFVMCVIILLVKEFVELNVFMYIIIGVGSYILCILISLRLLRKNLREYIKDFQL